MKTTQCLVLLLSVLLSGITSAQQLVDFRNAIRLAEPATVQVISRNKTIPQEDIGSGVIVDSSGLVMVANLHILKDNEYSVSLTDGRRLSAVQVVNDLATGLALLRVDEDELPAITLSEQEVELGLPVCAVYAFGAQDRVVGQGIVALDRYWHPTVRLEVFQADIPIYGNSSGGVVLDSSGDMVGVIVATSSGDPYRMPGPALAMHASEVNRLVGAVDGNQLVTISPGRLGVSLRDSEQRRGAIVQGTLPDSAAESAGIKAGDEIVKAGTRAVKNPQDLIAALAQYREDDEVKIRVRRDGEEAELTATLSEGQSRRSGATAETLLAPTGGVMYAIRDLDKNEFRLVFPIGDSEASAAQFEFAPPIAHRAQPVPPTPSTPNQSPAPRTPRLLIPGSQIGMPHPPRAIFQPRVLVERSDPEQQMRDLKKEIQQLREALKDKPD